MMTTVVVEIVQHGRCRRSASEDFWSPTVMVEIVVSSRSCRRYRHPSRNPSSGDRRPVRRDRLTVPVVPERAPPRTTMVAAPTAKYSAGLLQRRRLEHDPL
jgi:hypothetical protein